MKILHVVPSYLPAWRYGGPIRSVHGLARAQAGLGHAVTVFTTDADGPGRLAVETEREVALDGVAVRYFPRRFPARLFRAPELARELARRVGEFDVVHAHSVFLEPTRLAARAAERAGVPFFLSPRGMLVAELIRQRGAPRKRLWIRLVERRTLARASGIVVQSELERRELEQLGLPTAPIHVVPNGVDFGDDGRATPAERAAEVARIVAGGPYLLSLGRVSWKKGIDRLIAALPQLPGARLVVAGNDEEGLTPALARQAADLGVADRVHFVGEVGGEAKAALLGAAAVFCLPSRSENFGQAALEAMAAGRPVVLTPEVGLASFPEARAAVVLSPGEPAALAAAIGALLADPAAAARLGAAARAVAESHFAWPAIAARMTALYAAPADSGTGPS